MKREKKHNINMLIRHSFVMRYLAFLLAILTLENLILWVFFPLNFKMRQKKKKKSQPTLPGFREWETGGSMLECLGSLRLSVPRGKIRLVQRGAQEILVEDRRKARGGTRHLLFLSEAT